MNRPADDGTVSEPDDDVDQLAAEIMRYLRAHPDAADSVEGIVGWWLGLPSTAPVMAAAERALARLTAAGGLERRVLPGGRAVYARAAAGQAHEIAPDRSTAMADHRALMAVAQTVIEILRRSYRREDFDHDLEFAVYASRNFETPMASGVSLFVYRIFANGVQRTPPGRLGPDGRRQPTLLPLEMHFLLSIWGAHASLQHAIAGWMMRALEDAAILPAGLLNGVAPAAFRIDETVEICLAELRTEDLLRIWEALGPRVYQLSVPYLARTIRIESPDPGGPAGPGAVQQRVQRVTPYNSPGGG